MVIYEVSLQVNKSISGAFRKWLKDHVREVLRSDGFQSAQVCECEGAPAGHDSLVVQYWVDNREKLQEYFDNHAARLRADGVTRFGDQFNATRRVLLPEPPVIKEPSLAPNPAPVAGSRRG